MITNRPMITIWLTGLFRHRRGRLLAVSLGVALAVALLASLGAFLVAAQATMTDRASRSVTVDWQVQVADSADHAAVLDAVRHAAGTRLAVPVSRLDLPGLSATTGGSRQTTGAAVALGIPDGYLNDFPGEVRILAGQPSAVLVAQQTAANLHVGPGDRLQALTRPGGPPVTLTVGAVVDLPQANSLFQRVGAAPQAQPVAPPDNVIILPSRLFAAELVPRIPAPPTWQIHAARDRALPPNPQAAYVAESGAARNLEVALAGSGTVGDNLGAALDAARSDAAYAQVLFLFLGVPGAILAALLTASVAAAGAQRRRREQSLLRTRGADLATIGRIAALEGVLVAVAGGILGLLVAGLMTWLGPTGTMLAGASPMAFAPWFVAAVVVGAVVALLSVLLPVRRDLRHGTVVGARADPVARRTAAPILGWSIGIALIAIALMVFWSAGQSQYNLVLAPEGVPTIKVSYWALVAPVLLWVGGALLIRQVTDLLLRRGRRLLAVAARPLSGRMAPLAVASVARQRRPVAAAVVMVALATSFAISTATFNTTYQAQAEVDARLTNGADISVTQPGNDNALADRAQRIGAIPGVRTVEPMQHRYAYVGTDLQDLYGVRPGTIAAATSLQDAYFLGGTAAELMQRLAAQPDGILVSQETVTDFQLVPGDHLKLRLQDGRTRQYVEVPFTYIGIAKEFPTAPSDSFLVANAAYVGRQTHNDAPGTLLIDTGGLNTAAIADRVQQQVGPGGHVTDISTVRGTIGSSLTSVSLEGLTAVELTAAIVLAVAASGLVLGLGYNERRRSYAIAAILGARRRALSGFITVEAAVVVLLGLVGGAMLGAVLAQILTTVLGGVFDPAPASLAVPWPYLALLGFSVAGATISAVAAFTHSAADAPINALRDA